MKLIERVNGVPPRVTKQHPPIVPREDMAQAVIAPKVEPAPRLTASPFTIDHRAELIKEMRADADILDKEAAHKTHTAVSLRISADHLETHPPEP